MSDIELRQEQLRKRTDPSTLDFDTTEELPALDEVIGQERAVRSIDFGVDIPSPGYNIYAMGPVGSGRTTAVRKFLTRQAQERPVPAEWCYVYNFEDRRRPRALRLPPHRASVLRHQMDELVQQLQQEIPRAFEGEHYEQHRRDIMTRIQERQQELYHGLEQYLNERGFALIRSQVGLAIAPIIEGQVLTGEDYQKLDPETRKKFEAYRPELQEQFDKTMRQARDLDREARQAIENINEELAGFVVDGLLEDIRDNFRGCDDVQRYLDAVRQDVVDNVERFTAPPEQEGQQNIMAMLRQPQSERGLERYQVNVLAATDDGEHAPVIFEDNPTYHNLIGRIEHRAEFGAMITDFNQIRAGALHRANGGYLVVEAKKLLVNPLAWDGLKRALRSHEIKIEDMAQFYGMVATVSLEPEPIPLDVKVVIIGDAYIYQLLYIYDEDFRELFKVQAEFTPDMPRNAQNAHDYGRFVADVVRRENLRHFDRTAMARLLDETARLADDQEKITTRFAASADLVRESSFWASRAGRDLVTAEDVRRATDERRTQRDYIAQRYVERIMEGVMLIDTRDAVPGQINGLSVMQIADFQFGVPSRITARTFLGRAGVISIEREVKMSGPIHDKGQLILSSYLADRFAQRRPLSVSATLTFEQLYSGVEGDSASSTELYALLSALSGVPIKQGLAVTGSVNQAGQVQAIGGVNSKIEGFFNVCRAGGLTGDQGVLIPASNVRHLMLRDDVIEAVADGQFHIYAVSTIAQGIELLTGMPAGEPDEEGNYPEGTLYARVQAKLDEYAERMQEQNARRNGEAPPAHEPEDKEPGDTGDPGDPKLN
jgi:lon-related putative ATP-dependent protease